MAGVCARRCQRSVASELGTKIAEGQEDRAYAASAHPASPAVLKAAGPAAAAADKVRDAATGRGTD